MQEIRAHRKQSHQHLRPTIQHVSVTTTYQGGNSDFAMKIKLLSLSSQCPSVHQVFVTPGLPQLTACDGSQSDQRGYTPNAQHPEAHGFRPAAEELEIWELVVPSVSNQLALALSQRHLGWCRGDGKEQPGHRDRGQSKRGNKRWLLSFWAAADGNTHSLVTWLATTEREQLGNILLDLEVFIAKTWFAPQYWLGFRAQGGWKCARVGENSICGQSWIYLQSPGLASAAQTFPPFHTHITLSIPNRQFEKRTIKFCLKNTWHRIRFGCRHHCCPKAGQAFTSFTRCNPKGQTPRGGSKWPGRSSHTSLPHTSQMEAKFHREGELLLG